MLWADDEMFMLHGHLLHYCTVHSIHCRKEWVVLTNFGHLSCARNCCKSLNKVYKRPLAYHMVSCLPLE